MFLSDEAIELLWPLVTETPSVSAAYEEFAKIWAACGLPPQPLSPDLAGPVYCDDPDEPLLSEAERLRAADPALWQLVYIPPIFDSSGMEVLTFDSLEEAEAKLNSLKLGEIDEGGGIIFKAGVPVAEKLVLKYCEKEDFHGFLKDVTKEPERPLERSLEDNIKAVTEALLERINELKKLAPEIARLKGEYEGRPERPSMAYGKPCMALVELSKLFPDLVQLGGCCKPPP
ncbi:unnamed protein product [Durusdinium trenchii]|uniref:Uncharacterized protein n=1 Tax=Durusdinium trenchii TaxID=1381693 RepID=A0ABP0STL5_9DINO